MTRGGAASAPPIDLPSRDTEPTGTAVVPGSAAVELVVVRVGIGTGVTLPTICCEQPASPASAAALAVSVVSTRSLRRRADSDASRGAPSSCLGMRAQTSSCAENSASISLRDICSTL
jgi:hypothetical protein